MGCVFQKKLRETIDLGAIDPVESIELLDDLVVLLPGEIVVGDQGVDSEIPGAHVKLILD